MKTNLQSALTMQTHLLKFEFSYSLLAITVPNSLLAGYQGLLLERKTKP